MTRNINYHSTAVKINAVLIGIGLITFIVSFHPEWHIWGFDSFEIFPLWLRIALISIMLLASIPIFSTKIGKAIQKKVVVSRDAKNRAIYIVITLLLLGLFASYPSNNHFSGDGYFVQTDIVQGSKFSPTEPLDYYIHYLVYSLTVGGEEGALFSYRICSYILGLIFLLGLWHFIRKFDELILALVAVISFVVMQFFFGYMEDYTFAFVFMLFYLISANKDIENDHVSVLTPILLGLAAMSHLSSLILIPSFIYLLWILKRKRSAALVSIISLLLGIGILISYSSWVKGFKLDNITVPIFPNSDSQYHLLSVSHLSDLIKLFLLLGPTSFILLFLYKFISKTRLAFYLAAIIPAFLFTILVDPKIGMFRDWDLMSIASASIMALMLICLLSWNSQNAGEAYLIIIPLLTFGIIHTGSWIAQNHSKDYSYQKTLEFVQEDPHYTAGYFKGYLNKGWAILVWNNYHDAAEAARADEVRYEGDPDDTLNTTGLPSKYLLNEDTARAIQLVNTNWERFITSAEATLRLTSVFMETRRYKDAEIIYQSYVNKGGSDHRVIYNLAIIEDRLGRIDSAAVLYDRAFAAWNDAPITDELGFYIKALSLKKYQIGESGLIRIYPRIPEEHKDISRELINALASHNYLKADSITELMMQSSK